MQSSMLKQRCSHISGARSANRAPWLPQPRLSLRGAVHANALRATTEQRGCDVGDAGVKPDDLRLQLMISHMSFEGYWEEWDSLKLMRPTPDAEKVTTDPQSLFAVSEPEDAQQQLQDHPLLLELSYLESLVSQLSQARSVSEKLDLLHSNPRVQDFFQQPNNKAVVMALPLLSPDEQYMVLDIVALGQDHALQIPAGWHGDVPHALSSLATSLLRLEQFYDSIGGLAGYQAKSIELIVTGTPQLRAVYKQQHPEEQQVLDTSFHVPKALDLAGEEGMEVGQHMAACGLMAMPRMAEILPVGGAGDRLGLTCETTGESLPAAMLPYCGRSMLEIMVRDLQAREYLYYRLTGTQVVTPMAIMTSDAKGNHRRINQLLTSMDWFGRDPASFKLFRQPLVPVLEISGGKWLLSSPMRPMAKPGGHGAIWKLMYDEGVFDWLKQHGREAAIIRQISNPMSGVDTTLLALAGCGQQRSAEFGFMCCDRALGASEGCNVLQEKRVRKGDRWAYEYGYTNIEYTEFDRLGISDVPVEGNSRRSVFPANTNVLYVKLDAAKQVVDNAVATGNSEQLMPGLIFNLKKTVAYKDPLTQQEQKVQAGRMECTMQNIADHMSDRLDAPLKPQEVARKDLSTFLVYNMRRKVTSSAKKRREPGSTRINQTPDGSFFDLQRNAWHLLQRCGMQDLPEVGSVEQYLENGPGFICLFHPALGPLWDVISQKIVGGSLKQGSELVLEVSEARLRNLNIKGSFLVHANNVMGHEEANADSASSSFDGASHPHQLPFQVGMSTSPSALSSMSSMHGSMIGSTEDPTTQPSSHLVYSSRCGRINMTNVTIQNEGIDWAAEDNIYWRHKVTRKESVHVVLHGQSEFEAHDVVIKGSHTFHVPDGHRMVVTQGPQGSIHTCCEPLSHGAPTWHWLYSVESSGRITLTYSCPGSLTSAVPKLLFQPPTPAPPTASHLKAGAAQPKLRAQRQSSAPDFIDFEI